MRFTLQTLLLSFVLVASALAAFGPWGLLVAAVLLGIVVYLRVAEWMAGAALRLLEIGLVLFFGMCLLLPAYPARKSARRMACANNLKQIALSLYKYQDVYGTFPPAYVADESGTPMHSWRVLILPYLEQQALYAACDFSQPWDGRNNRPLAGTILREYRCPSDPASGSFATTNYVAVLGPNTAWPGDKPARLDDFKGRADRTILLVEVADSGIHWMEPRDLSPEDALKRISSYHLQDNGYFFHPQRGVHVGLVDGSVHFLPEEALPALLQPLLTGSGDPSLAENFRTPPKPHWGHIGGLAMLVLSFLVLLLRPKPK